MNSTEIVDGSREFIRVSRCGELYKQGRERFANCSMLEALALFERAVGRPMNSGHSDDNVSQRRQNAG